MVLCAKLSVDVHHAVLRMLFAVRRRLEPYEIIVRYLRAGTMRAKLFADAHHAVLSMLLTVFRLLASLDIEVRTPLTKLAVAPHSRHGLVRRMEAEDR